MRDSSRYDKLRVRWYPRVMGLVDIIDGLNLLIFGYTFRLNLRMRLALWEANRNLERRRRETEKANAR